MLVMNKTLPALLAAMVVFLLASNGLHAEIVNLKAELKGSEETPPTPSTGTGYFYWDL